MSDGIRGVIYCQKHDLCEYSSCCCLQTIAGSILHLHTNCSQNSHHCLFVASHFAFFSCFVESPSHRRATPPDSPRQGRAGGAVFFSHTVLFTSSSGKKLCLPENSRRQQLETKANVSKRLLDGSRPPNRSDFSTKRRFLFR